MDIKLNNATGELYVENGDVQFFKAKEKYFEVIQQIVLMLHVREGELEYDINYGLNFEKSAFHADNRCATDRKKHNRCLELYKKYGIFAV